MNVTVWLTNGFAVIGLLIALYSDWDRGIASLKRGLFSFVRILPTVLVIVVIIGLLLGFVPPETIQQFVGDRSGIGGLLLTGSIGSVLHIPSIVAFPLAASFQEMGASGDCYSPALSDLCFTFPQSWPFHSPLPSRRWGHRSRSSPRSLRRSP